MSVERDSTEVIGSVRAWFNTLANGFRCVLNYEVETLGAVCSETTALDQFVGFTWQKTQKGRRQRKPLPLCVQERVYHLSGTPPYLSPLRYLPKLPLQAGG